MHEIGTSFSIARGTDVSIQVRALVALFHDGGASCTSWSQGKITLVCLQVLHVVATTKCFFMKPVPVKPSSPLLG